MFCLECGTEMAVRARACPVCGHAYSDRELSLFESQPAHMAQTALASSGAGASAKPVPAPRSAPAVKYVGDLSSPSAAGLPRDLPGRFVLGVSLGMGADLLLPWVTINNEQVTPASIGAPAVVVVALLAAAILPVFTTSLRQHRVWSALPLMVGALCAGIAGTVWLLLAPLAQIFAVAFGSDPSNLVLSPESGLYLFLLGSAILLVAGQQMLVATHTRALADARRDAVYALQVLQTKPAASPAPAVAPSAPTAPTAPTASTSSTPEASAPPTASPERQAPVIPAAYRTGPGSTWNRSRGPHRLR